MLGLERLGAYADLRNGRSQAALERLGFVREGTRRRWHRHGERVHDVILFSWPKEAWDEMVNYSPEYPNPYRNGHGPGRI